MGRQQDLLLDQYQSPSDVGHDLPELQCNDQKSRKMLSKGMMAYGGVPLPSLEPGVKQQLFGSNQNSELEQVEEPVVAGAVDV